MIETREDRSRMSGRPLFQREELSFAGFVREGRVCLLDEGAEKWVLSRTRPTSRKGVKTLGGERNGDLPL